MDLDPFYAKVKFGHIGFCMGKSEFFFFFFFFFLGGGGTIAALGVKVA